MAKTVTVAEAVATYMEEHPGVAPEDALTWARSEVKRQAARSRWAARGAAPTSNGTAHAADDAQEARAVDAKPEPAADAPPQWHRDIFDAATVLRDAVDGKVEPLDGISAANVLLVQAAAHLH